ncbi:hypothetical protein GTZ78_09570 [Streptomyces sp. SID8361]|uniref:hypothetical protein n=1 Tax=Streptomyces sp. MnatMP-M27 TaxID=1839768 RepID=UPI00081ED162|nr:hypothetical protein [Streptomyces sp. MnatMP-M27]MYU10935.1 hypothetical protein [Streptomyces sp. SID8361]SCF76656.1 hypothetical protein GA0115260_1022811 [Streptomyces sp. MnatMP-M27]
MGRPRRLNSGHLPAEPAAAAAPNPPGARNDRKHIAAQGGRVDGSATMEGYFEEDGGWEDNAMIGVL